MDRSEKRPDPAKRPFKMPRLMLWLPLLLLWLVMWQGLMEPVSSATIPYSDFKQRIAAGDVVEVALSETEVRGLLKPNGAPVEPAVPQDRWYSDILPPSLERLSVNGSYFRSIRVEDPKLVEELMAAGVRITGTRPSLLSQILWSWILPVLFLVVLWSWLARRVSNVGSSMLSIGKSRAKLHVDRETNVTFKDVAGCEEAKHELEEVVDFLRMPDRYKALGAQIPKGVLLVGPPGTGKTLLARAVAGEAGVPFFAISGSDFVEMFVGVGASRVRDLFEQAKKQAPCIIFIDEVDTIGRHRSVHAGVANDEREQTLNQLLTEMDGFEPNAGVIVLAATNRPEVLDRALLRPGRFDRQVVLDAPDLLGRVAILKVHTRAKPLAANVDLTKVARQTPGFSGADLANTVNEAALFATRRGRKAIGQADLEEAIEKVIAGPERKSRRLGEKERRRVAFHEVGHALVSSLCENADPVHKISIVPRGRAALGYTLQLPESEQFLMTKSALLDRIRGLLGGRAAEELMFGDISTGAENDLEKATAIAEQMVCLYGMGRKVGLTHYAERRPLYLVGREGEGLAKSCSPETARMIDEEVRAILDEALADARRLLKSHKADLERIATLLIQRETLEGDDLRKMLDAARTDAPRSVPSEGASHGAQ